MLYCNIKMQEKEIRIEDHAGRRMFLIKLEGLKKFEKRMLSEGGCASFLPMKFINDSADELAYYDFTDCIQMCEYLKMKEEESSSSENKGEFAILILDLIEDIFQCLKRIEKYLFFPDEVSVDPDAIFVDAKAGTVILAYMKNTEPEQTLQKRIIDTIETISLNCQNTEARQCIINFVDQVKAKNPGLDGMIGILNMMKRDLYYIFWVPENFRNNAANIPCSDEIITVGNKQFVSEETRQKITSIMQKPRWSLPLMLGASVICLGGAYSLGFHGIESIAGITILTIGVNLMIFRKITVQRKKVCNQ